MMNTQNVQFYHDMLGLEAVADFGANVTLTGGVRQTRGVIFVPRPTERQGVNGLRMRKQHEKNLKWVGIGLILVSLVFRYGAELEESMQGN